MTVYIYICWHIEIVLAAHNFEFALPYDRTGIKNIVTAYIYICWHMEIVLAACKFEFALPYVE